MNSRKILIFLVIIAILALILIDCGGGGLKIQSIEDGNTVKLDTGTKVRLIGVTNTTEGRSSLAEYKGKKVRLVSDSRFSFNTEQMSDGEFVYAYVITEDENICINAELLKRGVVLLLENAYLNDSLTSFRKYADDGSNKRPYQSLNPIEPKINYTQDSIRLPNYTPQQVRRYQYWSTDEAHNEEMLNEACDYNLPYTKMFANDLAGRSPGEFNIGQICEIFDYCFQNWRYVNDPKGQEYIASASESINCSLAGDCDDFAVLMASCILAIGGDASIISARRSNGSGHAYSEVDVSNFSEKDLFGIIQERFPQYNIAALNTSTHDGKKWLNLDWQAGYPGGPYWEANESQKYVFSSSLNTWESNSYSGSDKNLSSSQSVTIFDSDGSLYATGFLVETSSNASLRMENCIYELVVSDKPVYRYKVKNQGLYVK